MKKGIAWIIVTCIVLFSYSATAEGPSPAQREKCLVCGMFISMFADWNARIEFKDSPAALFCGPKCMFKHYLNAKKHSTSVRKKEITKIFVKDYYSQASIDALHAFYVIWSDVYGPMGHEPIPFEKEADAKKFLKEHNGKKTLRFSDIGLSLVSSFDNPP
jgi:nitrous oxide reductase accessory protein NosL